MGFTGRLRGITLDEEYKALIDEYFRRKAIISKNPKSEINIDLDIVKKLEAESAEIIQKLAPQSDLSEKEEPEKKVVHKGNTIKISEATPILKEETKEISDEFYWLEDLEEAKKEILKAVFFEKDKKIIREIANKYLNMPELLIDDINMASNEYIGDILIDTNNDLFTISEEYKPVIEKILIKGDI